MEIKRLKGTRDYDPSRAEMLFKIIEVGRSIFPKYGFLPLDTSSLERWETLVSKDVNAGDEIKEQTYNFIDRGGKHIGLRYDLTVPLIRYIYEHKNIVLPFKRYQIGKVYRYEEAKRSRYREFYQFDLDVIGGKSFLYDAELLKVAEKFYEVIGVKNFRFIINNRKFMESFLSSLGVKKENFINVMRVIDKIDKLTFDEFKGEIHKYINKATNIEELYDILSKEFKKVEDFVTFFGGDGKDLFELYDYLKSLGVKRFFFSMKIVRGLGYYTSNVFETFVDNNLELGSIGSGGRYDDVFDRIIKMHIPSVGYSFGVDRILDYIYLKKGNKIPLDIYICYVSKDLINKAIKIRDVLASIGLRVFLRYDFKNLTNQIKHANALGVEHIIILGKKDLDKGVITYRNLKSGEEKKISMNELRVLKNVVCRN